MPNLLYNYIFVSLHFTFSAFPMIIQISVSRFRFVNALSIATLLPSLRGKHYFHPLLLSLVGSVSLYALSIATLLPSLRGKHYFHPLLLSLVGCVSLYALSIATLLPSLRGKHYFHPLLLSLVGSVSLYALSIAPPLELPSNSRKVSDTERNLGDHVISVSLKEW